MFDYDSTKDLTEWAEDMADSHRPNGKPTRGCNELLYRALAIKLRRLAELEAREPTMTVTGGGFGQVFLPTVWIAPTEQ